MNLLFRAGLLLALLALALTPARSADTPYPNSVIDYRTQPVWMVDPATGLAVNPNGTPSAPKYVQTPTPATVTAGQGRIATASTAVCLPSAALQNGIVVKALAGNSGSLTVGGATVTAASDGTGNGYVLAPGEAMSFAVSNASLVCFNGTGVGDGVSYAGN